jgi:MFS family permease
MGWYRELDGGQKKTFWACFAGWALDAMDVQIYALVATAIATAWSLSKAQMGYAATVALAFSSIGGILAGWLADRIGRVRVLQIAILWFTTFTFLSGLAQNFEQLLIARSLQGIGFGGEWAAGAVLVAEVVSPKVRGKAVAAVASGWSVGYGAAAILYMLMFRFLPSDIAWRAMFFVGVIPASLVFVFFFLRNPVTDPKIYLAARAQRDSSAKLSTLLTGALGLRTLIAWAICLGVLGGNYTVLFWLPTYLQQIRHLSIAGVGLYLLVNIAGSFLGYILGGYVSDGLGRRNALKLFAILGALSVYAYLTLGTSSSMVMALGFPLGFAQSAMNAGVGPLLSEIFPTQLRATGQGFCYNAGRGVGAFFPALVGIASASMGLTQAIAAAAVCAYAVALLCSFLLPETRNRDLASIDLAGNAR